MGWFRRHSRLTGWLALLALALQLGLAFGHVHGDAYGHNSQIAALTSDQPGGGERHGPAAPSDHDYCAVCAVLSLLAGAQTADAPPVPAPLAIAAVTLGAEPETIRAIGASSAFRSRAPPLS